MKTLNQVASLLSKLDYRSKEEIAYFLKKHKFRYDLGKYEKSARKIEMKTKGIVWYENRSDHIVLYSLHPNCHL